MKRTLTLTLTLEVEGEEAAIAGFEEVIQGDLSQPVLQEIWDDTCPLCKVWRESKEYQYTMNLSLLGGRITKAA
ncbi:MAG: hypothetical protein JXA33_04930 [Anaerolineae bacterium]|nr:hypothetical protein [Anaerolineae bacterium]